MNLCEHGWDPAGLHQSWEAWQLDSTSISIKCNAAVAHNVRPHKLCMVGASLPCRNKTPREKKTPQVHAEFLDWNFVVKRTKRRFNQISADQETEWTYRTCKMHNGTIGITRNGQARDRLSVKLSGRSCISQESRSLFILEDDDEKTLFCRSDSLPSRTLGMLLIMCRSSLLCLDARTQKHNGHLRTVQ